MENEELLQETISTTSEYASETDESAETAKAETVNDAVNEAEEDTEVEEKVQTDAADDKEQALNDSESAEEPLPEKKPEVAETMADYEKELEESYKKSTKQDESDDPSWEIIRGYFNEKQIINEKVTEAVNKGVVMMVEGKRGFIPASKLALTHVDDLNEFVGKNLEVRVIELDESKNKFVLSAKDILLEKANEEKEQVLMSLKPGITVDGKVESVVDFGAFINLGGVTGLLHSSQMNKAKDAPPSDILKEGDEVKVRITRIETNQKKGDPKISLSMLPPRERQGERTREPRERERFTYKSDGEATTSLSGLLKNIKLS